MIYYILIFTIFLFILFLLGLGAYNKIIFRKSHFKKDSLPSLNQKQETLKHNLEQHVNQLAGKIGERNMAHFNALNQAANYIQEQLESTSFKVNRHTFQYKEETLNNIVAEMKGTTSPEEIIIIGAHYDSVSGSPGANDNASGIAALLELGRLMSEIKPSRTLRLLAFVNEEPPYFMTQGMGSFQYARQASEKNEKIKAMLSLETIGYYSNQAKSQRYPFPFKFFYPNTGDFIGFVGRIREKSLLRKCIKTFRSNSEFKAEAAVGPGWLTGISWSDQWSFWQFKYPAIMITDTAPFRYPYYHTAKDTPDKVDYESMAWVTEGLYEVILNLVKK